MEQEPDTATSTGQPGPSRTARPLILLGLSALVILAWWGSGWAWWPLLWGVPPLLAVRLPGLRRLVDEQTGLAIALGLVGVQLLGAVEDSAAGWFAVCAAVLTPAAVVLARRPRRGWPRWATIGATVLSAVGLTVSGLLWWLAVDERQEARADAFEQRHQQWRDEAKPDTPQAMVAELGQQIGQPERAERHDCLEFTPAAGRLWAEQQTGQPDCVRAFELLHERIRDWNAYVNYTWLPSAAITQQWRGDPALTRVNACELEFGPIWQPVEDAGPMLGVLVLRESEFSDTAGQTVVDAQPCP